MRNRTLNLLAAALLLFGATSASAYSLDMTRRGFESTNVVTGISSTSVITVDVFFTNNEVGDVDVGLLSVGVVFDNPGMQYDAVATEILPVIYAAPANPPYNTTGGGPAYILFAPAGRGVIAMYRQQTPWQTFPAPPGSGQVNVNFAVPGGVGSTPAKASNTWIGSLVFHVESGYAGGLIQLCMTCGGNILSTTNGNESTLVALGAPLVLVPEPTTAALIGLGVLGLAIAGRRK